MPKENKKKYDIFDLMVDDILEATDEEIIQEAIEDGIDIEKQAFETRKLFNKCRYDLAKKTLDVEKGNEGQTPPPISIKDARRKIDDLLKTNHDALKNLTKAARSGSDIPDEDILGYYDDLLELGFFDGENLSGDD